MSEHIQIRGVVRRGHTKYVEYRLVNSKHRAVGHGDYGVVNLKMVRFWGGTPPTKGSPSGRVLVTFVNSKEPERLHSIACGDTDYTWVT